VLLDVGSGQLMVERSRARRKIRRSAFWTEWQNSLPRNRSQENRILQPRHDDHHERAFGDAWRQGRPLDHQEFPRVQEVQNQARDTMLFDYFYAKPQPIAPQSLTKEIPERSDYAGNVLLALDGEAVRRARARA